MIETKKSAKFSKQELTLLAKAICQEYISYVKDSKDQDFENFTLTQIFSIIIGSKNKQIDELKHNLEFMIYNNQARNNENQHLHMVHESQKQVDRQCQVQKQKLFTRLLAIKNQKVQQLDYLKQTYDVLFQHYKKLKQREQLLTKKVEDLERQQSLRLKQIAQLNDSLHQRDLKIQKLQGQLNKAKLKIAEVSQKYKVLKENFFKNQKITRDEFHQCLKNIMEISVKNVVAAVQLFFNQRRAREMLKVQNDKSLQQKDVIIRELVEDLSVAIKLPMKSSQSQMQWIHEYRTYKQIKKNRPTYTDYLQNMYPKPPQDQISKFVANQTRSLRQFQTIKR